MAVEGTATTITTTEEMMWTEETMNIDGKEVEEVTDSEEMMMEGEETGIGEMTTVGGEMD